MGDLFQFSGASEAQRVMLVLSHIPFLGMIVANKYPNVVTVAGARISSIFGCIYILSYIHDGFNVLSMILLFIGIFLIVFLAARFFIHESYTVPYILTCIPDMKSIYKVLRSIPPYLMDMSQVVFGKKESLSFAKNLQDTQEKDESFRASLQEYFTNETLSFSSFWIFIPFFNLIFLPKLLTERTTRYVLAIGQGLVITLLAVIIGYFFGATSPVALLLLFPVFYGISSLESDIFTRIPFIYEIYLIINTLTFGLLNNTKRLRSVQKQNASVSFKL